MAVTKTVRAAQPVSEPVPPTTGELTWRTREDYDELMRRPCHLVASKVVTDDAGTPYFSTLCGSDRLGESVVRVTSTPGDVTCPRCRRKAPR